MSGTASRDAWVDDVLGFWFKELGPEDWYKKDAAIDATIRACNMFRGSPKSFASDAQALTAARSAIARAFDRQLAAQRAPAPLHAIPA